MEVGVVEQTVVLGEVALLLLFQEGVVGHAVYSLITLRLKAEKVECISGVLGTIDCLDCVQSILPTKSYHFVNLRLVHVLSEIDKRHLD